MKPKLYINRDARTIEKDISAITKAGRQVGFEVEYIRPNDKRHNKPIAKGKNVVLGIHSRKKGHRFFNIKHSYLPDYWYFDRWGYSGWSEMTAIDSWKTVNHLEASKWFNQFSHAYITSNQSKYRQPPQANTRLPDRYFFYAAQHDNDTVMKLARIPQHKAILEAARAIHPIKLVVKPHPKWGVPVHNLLRRNREIIEYKGSIHSAIAESQGVIVNNSGVGFEALLHLKHVFTIGQCDYQWVTTPIQTRHEMGKLLDATKKEVDVEAIQKFVYYFLNTHLMNLTKPETIEAKLRPLLRKKLFI